MRAAVLTGLETVELQERPEPEARPGWAVVAVESASICGTDVHQFDGRIDTPFPRVPGHDFAGRVDAVGDALGSARATRRVVVLLSDCRATDEQDPLPAAAAIPELLILAPRDDTDEAAALAAASGAKWAALDSVDAAVRTLNDLLV